MLRSIIVAKNLFSSFSQSEWKEKMKRLFIYTNEYREVHLENVMKLINFGQIIIVLMNILINIRVFLLALVFYLKYFK